VAWEYAVVGMWIHSEKGWVAGIEGCEYPGYWIREYLFVDQRQHAMAQRQKTEVFHLSVGVYRNRILVGEGQDLRCGQP